MIRLSASERAAWQRNVGHKYGAVRTEVDGIKFASKAEAKRYGELKLLEKAGEIEGLELQPKFPILIDGQKICTYIGDFAYRVTHNMNPPMRVVEDVKGVKTAVYKIKKKLVLSQYGISITEVA